MGLIAREIESQGIPTLSLSSALSITQSVNPPRAVFLDFPLGHTSGRPHDEKIQDAIIEAALVAFETMETPGSLHRPPIDWGDDGEWKAALAPPRTADGNAETLRDDRTERSGEPQYQLDSDRVAAESGLGG